MFFNLIKLYAILLANRKGIVQWFKLNFHSV